MTTIVFVLICVLAALVVGTGLYCIMAAASKTSRMEERWLHPPDDDDGVSILEEDDPDGENTR